MGRRNVVVFNDDMTGQDCDLVQEIKFFYEGREYVADLGEESYRVWSEMIMPYVKIGRLTNRGIHTPAVFDVAESNEDALPEASASDVPAPRAPEKVAAKDDPEQRKAVRAWWEKNETRRSLPPFTQFGRLPASVLEAYDKHAGRNGAKAVEFASNGQAD